MRKCGGMKISKQLRIIFDWALNLSANLANILMIFLTLAVCFEVFMRYFLGQPTNWVVDISACILLYTTFLAAGFLLRSEEHVTVDLLFNKFSRKTQCFLNVVTSSFGTLTVAALVWFGGKVTWENLRQGIQILGGVSYPKWVVLAIIPIGSFLLMIQFIRRTYGHLVTWLLETKK